jgi:AcrR family transcriptional regulator
MPPRIRYTAEKILDAALSLTHAEGIDMVTARNVAAGLGCSTGPIFTHFASMDDLHEQLMDVIIGRFVATASEASHDDPLIGAGVGWLRFAAEEPRLYEAVFLRPHPWHAKWGPIRRKLAERMADHPRYAHLDRAARFAIVGRASIVMHGLGVEIWSGRLPQHDLRLLIEEFAVPVVDAALAQGWTTDLHSSSPLTSHSSKHPRTP